MWARLQDFPDNWEFVGGRTAVAYQIGNAVPPRLAQAAGLALFAALQNVEFEWESLLWPRERARLGVEAPSLQPADCEVLTRDAFDLA
ncbi:DNA cytosine methyltransferase (plasmid) [Rhizobium sp. CC1099]|uniref:DNA cytosine methyltransferase n=1 Tax=Rhizobium sp. CC1099 TaxID=3039160 RepID=UPI0024B16D82|nr:DNA cytosine methyltransferase [Rhizobium sp. CC1099]WFU91857.1 DNA cytosine methyltransferase [Rhizobium sp. CC1099]